MSWLPAALGSIDAGKVIAACLTPVVAFLFQFLAAAPKVGWGVSHGFRFALGGSGEKPMLVDTRSIFVQNIGRASAKNLEVHMTGEPVHYHIWPSQNFQTDKNPEGNFIIKMASLGKGEYFSIEMIAGPDLIPIVLRVRTEAGECPQVPMRPMQVHPMWKHRIFRALSVAGIFGVLVALISIIRLFVDVFR